MHGGGCLGPPVETTDCPLASSIRFCYVPKTDFGFSQLRPGHLRVGPLPWRAAVCCRVRNRRSSAEHAAVRSRAEGCGALQLTHANKSHTCSRRPAADIVPGAVIYRARPRAGARTRRRATCQSSQPCVCAQVRTPLIDQGHPSLVASSEALFNVCRFVLKPGVGTFCAMASPLQPSRPPPRVLGIADIKSGRGWLTAERASVDLPCVRAGADSSLVHNAWPACRRANMVSIIPAAAI